jgi:uncharacterized membrane protein YbhN (UPF0104 family)
MAKQRRAAMPEALKAEAVLFAVDAISVVTLLAGLFVFQFDTSAAIATVLLIIVIAMFLGNILAQVLTHTPLRLPAEFWWKGSTVAIIALCMAGWIAHGVALHVVVSELPGDMTLRDSLMFGPASAVLGVATGLPGGIGATESILGASLRIRSVPIEHLAIAITMFRLITFWLWIPIGWIAIAMLRRRSPQPAEPAGATPRD